MWIPHLLNPHAGKQITAGASSRQYQVQPRHWQSFPSKQKKVHRKNLLGVVRESLRGIARNSTSKNVEQR
jgi:hypothetical protein